MTHPHAHPTMRQTAKPARRTGRKGRGFNQAVPHYTSLRLMHPHDPPPASADWLSMLPANLGMMLNGFDPDNPGAPQLGCCPIAGLHHARQVWSMAASGVEITDPLDDVLIDYRGLCGYDGTPATDAGGVLQVVLAGACSRGLTTATGPDKLLAFVEVDPTSVENIKTIIASGGVAYAGIRVSDSLENSQPGDLISRTDDIGQDGHCIILSAYDADTVTAITWGFRVRFTWAAFLAACDEIYWPADGLWIEKTGMTPGNLTQAELIAAMQPLRSA